MSYPEWPALSHRVTKRIDVIGTDITFTAYAYEHRLRVVLFFSPVVLPAVKLGKKKEELLAVTVFGRTVVFGSILHFNEHQKKSNNCDLLPCYLPYLTP